MVELANAIPESAEITTERDTISYYSAVITPATDRSLSTYRQRVDHQGTLLGLAIEILTGTPSEDLFVHAYIEDNKKQTIKHDLFMGYVSPGKKPWGAGGILVGPSDNIRLDTWGYVTTTIRMTGKILRGAQRQSAWFGVYQSNLDGKGKFREIIGSNPAAGSEATFDVATGQLIDVQSIKVRLVASTKTSNRIIDLIHNSSTASTIGAFPSTYSQTANQDCGEYYAHMGVNSDTAREVNSLRINLPRKFVLLSGQELTTATESMKADDNYDAMIITGYDKIII